MDNLGPTLGILPQFIRDEETQIPYTSEDISGSIDSIAELIIVDEIELEVLE